MADQDMTEEQMVHLVRNALLVAGTEMGTDGDHWPVIKSTVHEIMKDWENLQIERNVDAEMKTHLYADLETMEKNIDQCPAENRAAIVEKLKELREIYDAYFSAAAQEPVDINSADMPVHIKRAKAIIDTLEGENE